MIKVLPIPALKDNYIWLIVDSSTQTCILVDPGAAEPVLLALQQLALTPLAILVTHHHWDHTQGIGDILNSYQIPVYGPSHEKSNGLSHCLNDSITLKINPIPLKLTVIAIPGHTHEHIAYYGENKLFCGDTLFTGGCGRVFEGTPQQMYQSLQKLAALPPHTEIYCGHEYTEANLAFAQAVEPNNARLQERIKATKSLRQQLLPTVPSTLALEKQTNPFLRCTEPSVHRAAEVYSKQKLLDPVAVFTVIRQWKNAF